MIIKAVINQKGGVGKSTVSCNISYGAALEGKRVLLVDLDPQGHSTAIFADHESPPANTMSDLFGNRAFPIEKAIYPAICLKEPVANLHLIPANNELATAAEQVASRVHREKILARHLDKVADKYDIAILDCPPTLGVLVVNGIYAADQFLIPTTYGRYSLDGIADLFAVIKDVKETENFSYRIIRNCYDSRNSLTNTFVDRELAPFEANLASTLVRKVEAVNQAQCGGQPIYTYDPKSPAVQDFKALTRELVQWEN